MASQEELRAKGPEGGANMRDFPDKQVSGEHGADSMETSAEKLWLEIRDLSDYAETIQHIKALLAQVAAESALAEALAMRGKYHHLEEWERQLKFVQHMDKRVSELEAALAKKGSAE